MKENKDQSAREFATSQSISVRKFRPKLEKNGKKD
jgi:hypothetical protein